MIKGIFADIIIAVYLLGTLLLRIMAEPALENHPFISIAAVERKSIYKVYLIIFLGCIIFLSPVIFSNALSQVYFLNIPLIYFYFCFFWVFYIYLIFRLSKSITF